MVMAWLLGLACFALAPSRVLVFLLLTTAVAWAQMAFNTGTGHAPHHVVLLWPFPAIFIGVAAMDVAKKLNGGRVVAVVTAVFCVVNLLNINEYLYSFATSGAAGVWTDAIDRLSVVLPADKKDGAAAGGKAWIGAVDWGFLNGVRWLHDGDIPLFVASDQIGHPQEFLEMVEAPDRLFVRHTDDKQVFPAVNEKFRRAAAAAGYNERIERIVTDSNERPFFVLFRMVKAEPQP
jgi:hypothetical protein